MQNTVERNQSDVLENNGDNHKAQLSHQTRKPFVIKRHQEPTHVKYENFPFL